MSFAGTSPSSQEYNRSEKVTTERSRRRPNRVVNKQAIQGTQASESRKVTSEKAFIEFLEFEIMVGRS
ncbi:hypothetical protein LR48_Vigan10g187200 [Vigna angularis]|uniref:Uncharacterized protein n=1 Tax=Phaseolus angularis TaxID=3914 RepID=A0A0L9VLS5_PHAAN|nr:hypothetical protein LR48_Vigan10g187200 [Vigna angularis]